MIFGKPLDRLVLEGKKTATRRPVRTKDGYVVPCRYRPSTGNGTPRSYAVQRKRGGREVARIEIDDVTREPLGDIDYAGAREEGFRTRLGFVEYWIRLHDKPWVTRQAPDCARCHGTGIDAQADETDTRHTFPCGYCSATGKADDDLDESTLTERFDDRHAHRIVWVVRFHLLDPPRLLAAGGASGASYRTLPRASGKAKGRQVAHDRAEDTETDLGYTSNEHNALPDEPEAVDEATLERLVKEARARGPLQRGYLDQQLIDEAVDLQDRIRRVREVAKRRGVDVRADLRVIEARLAQINAELARRRAA